MLRKLYVSHVRIITHEPCTVVGGWSSGNRFNSLHDREMIAPVKIIAIHRVRYISSPGPDTALR